KSRNGPNRATGELCPCLYAGTSNPSPYPARHSVSRQETRHRRSRNQNTPPGNFYANSRSTSTRDRLRWVKDIRASRRRAAFLRSHHPERDSDLRRGPSSGGCCPARRDRILAHRRRGPALSRSTLCTFAALKHHENAIRRSPEVHSEIPSPYTFEDTSDGVVWDTEPIKRPT